MNSFISQSQFQKDQTTRNTFKRNKHHYDAQKINRVQKIYSMKRRKPKQTSLIKYLQDKVNQSFQSSQINLSQKVAIDIQRYRERISQTQLFRNNSGQNKSMTPQKKSPNKGVPLQTMTSRDYFYNLQNKVVSDERLFNNFKLLPPPINKTFDLRKSPTRSIQFSHKHMNDIFYQTQRPYEENYYKKQTNSCRFQYKKQKIIPRYFYSKRRQADIPSTDLDPQKIKQSFEVVSSFDKFKGIPFYFQSARQIPPQLQIRNLSPNKDYWRNKDNKFIRPEVDYTLRKIKEQMIKSRLGQIKSKRKPKVSRGQICDERYFRIHKVQPFIEPVAQIEG